jgi:hypothetical protein
MRTHEINLEAPKGSQILILSTEMRLTAQQAETLQERGEVIRERIKHATETNDWPVMIVVDSAIDVRWVENPERYPDVTLP